jgi:hypothetical protein
MSNDGGKQDTGSDAGWTNVQSNKSFNTGGKDGKGETWTGKSDSEVKKDIETRKETRARETEFQNYNKPPVKYTGPLLTMKLLNWTGNKISQSKFAKDTNLKNRTFFTDKVLSKKGVYDGNTKLSKSEFQNLSVDKQNEIYGGYLEGRMSGQTDAYGNVNPNFGKDSDPPKRITEKQIETESEQEENKTDPKTEEEKEDEYKKVKGLKGARSMFGNAGGRGYFDPAR